MESQLDIHCEQLFVQATCPAFISDRFRHLVKSHYLREGFSKLYHPGREKSTSRACLRFLHVTRSLQ